MQCVILAGGRASRLGSLAAAVPKHLLPVAGRPFADHQLAWLRSEGVEEVVYCIGHLGDQIRAHVGDGRRFGVRVVYVDEGDARLGTGGALRRAADEGVLAPTFLVLYGDSFLSVDLGAVDGAHRRSARPALMTVFANRGALGRSNVLLEDGVIVRYDKDAPAEVSARMQHIDYGLLAFTREVIIDGIPSGEAQDLSVLLGRLAEEGRLAAYVATDRFYEIGSPEGLAELDTLLAARSEA